MSLILILIGILAVLGMFVAYNAGYDEGFSVGHDDGFDHAHGMSLPPLSGLKDFEEEVEELMETRSKRGCAACDRGDYQLGHADWCPKSEPLATEGHHHAS